VDKFKSLSKGKNPTICKNYAGSSKSENKHIDREDETKRTRCFLTHVTAQQAENQ